MVADGWQGRLRWAAEGWASWARGEGEDGGGESRTKLKPNVIDDVEREAEQEETIHYKLLGLGDNNDVAGEEEEGKKKQWHSAGDDEDKA